MLPPTTLGGPAAPLPYQLELAAITAAINQMKQRDAENPINPNNLPYVISDTQCAEVSAALAKLEKNRPVPPQQAEVSPPETAPTPIAATADRLPDDSNRPDQRLTAELQLPVEPPDQMPWNHLTRHPLQPRHFATFLPSIQDQSIALTMMTETTSTTRVDDR